MNPIIKKPVEIRLSVPTAFPEFNRLHHKSSDFESTSIFVAPMKQGHFRRMESLPEAKKIHFLMQELTGLSQNDLDELDIDDSAELTKVIINYMKKFVQITKEIAVYKHWHTHYKQKAVTAS